MSVNRIILVIILAGCLFFTWILIKNAFFNSTAGTASASASVTASVTASASENFNSTLPDRTISQGSLQAPINSTESVLYAPARPNDTMYNENESSEIPERLRNPERMFKQAEQPGESDIAVEGGLASFRGLTSRSTNANIIQQFSPELAQNGGEFMDNIFANDGEKSTYSDI